MSDIYIFLFILISIYFSLRNPVIAFCLNIWIDLIKPQAITFGFIHNQPLSAIAFFTLFISLVINIRKLKFSNLKVHFLFFLLFIPLITYTTYQSNYLEAALFKYDWVLKCMLIYILLPAIINSRKSFELILLTYMLSLYFHIIAGGVKTLFGGGGYGIRLSAYAEANAGLGESSTLALISVISIPLLIFVNNQVSLVKEMPLKKPIFYFLLTVSFACCVGTFARTGLIGLAVLTLIAIMKSSRKILYLSFATVIALVILSFSSNSWKERMGTINNANQESSALGRIVVWKWTLDFVKENPMGGGFVAYLNNAGLLDIYHETEVSFGNKAKAFHNIYFEVLGEQGYVGLFLYLMYFYSSFKATKILASSKLPWYREYGTTGYAVILCLAVCCCFIGVAYQSFLLIALGLDHASKKIYINESNCKI